MIRKIFERFAEILAGVSTSLVLIMPVAIVADVLSRTFFNHPFAAVFEGVEYSIVWIPLLSTPFITLANDHIVVDLIDGLFEKKYGKTLRLVLQAIGAVLSLAAIVLLAIAAWDSIANAFEQGTLMNTTLRPPRWIIHSIIPVGITLTALAFLTLAVSAIVQLFSRKHRSDGSVAQEE